MRASQPYDCAAQGAGGLRVAAQGAPPLVIDPSRRNQGHAGDPQHFQGVFGSVDYSMPSARRGDGGHYAGVLYAVSRPIVRAYHVHLFTHAEGCKSSDRLAGELSDSVAPTCDRTVESVTWCDGPALPMAATTATAGAAGPDTTEDALIPQRKTTTSSGGVVRSDVPVSSDRKRWYKAAHMDRSDRELLPLSPRP